MTPRTNYKFAADFNLVMLRIYVYLLSNIKLQCIFNENVLLKLTLYIGLFVNTVVLTYFKSLNTCYIQPNYNKRYKNSQKC